MEIKRASYLISSPSVNDCPTPDRAEFAFIGRSNVGKSSLINMLTNNSKLAKTSSSPGKTQMINHFDVASASKLRDESQETWFNWYLVDLPGYGYAKVSQAERKKWEKMMEGYFINRPNLTNVFVLLDSRLEPQKIDLEFLEKLRDWNVNMTLVFTKSDKENQRTVAKNVNAFIEKMRESWQVLPRHFVTSSVKKSGRDKMLKYLDETLRGLTG